MQLSIYNYIPNDSVDAKVAALIAELKYTYLQDARPWLIGLSGGKDSTCVTQLVYTMLLSLRPNERMKMVYILTSDVLVDSPLADIRRKHVCRLISQQINRDKLPIRLCVVQPNPAETFWVCMIGRGYPSPNYIFRWCTKYLKIKPMNRFVQSHIAGEVVMVTGSRKSESLNRKRTIQRHAVSGQRLTPHNSLRNAFVYNPIVDWSDDDVFTYLRQTPSPWNDDNNKFLDEYYGCGRVNGLLATCKKAPRMGCWCCTVASRVWWDEQCIRNGYSQLKPLVEFRNWIKEIRNEPARRTGVSNRRTFKGKEGKPCGKYILSTRHEILERLLTLLRDYPETKNELDSIGYTLIRPYEIDMIVKLWVEDGDSMDEINELLTRCGKNVGQ